MAGLYAGGSVQPGGEPESRGLPGGDGGQPRLPCPPMHGPRRIGILTGGGDVPGLNPVIKSVTYRATELGMEVVGIRRGWEGLTHVRPGSDGDPDYIRPLDRRNTRTIDRTGGTILHTTRTNPAKMTEA